MPVGFRSLKKGSHPCSQSRPHCLPARWLRMRKTDSIKALWGEGIWVPNKAKGPGGHVHSRAGVSPGRVTPAGVAPATGSVSPSPGSSPSPPASPLRLLRYFPPQSPSSRKVFALPALACHFRLCVPVRVRNGTAPPPGRTRWPVALARLPIAHALSLRTRDESWQGEPNGARSALLYPLKMP